MRTVPQVRAAEPALVRREDPDLTEELGKDPEITSKKVRNIRRSIVGDDEIDGKDSLSLEERRMLSNID